MQTTLVVYQRFDCGLLIYSTNHCKNQPNKSTTDIQVYYRIANKQIITYKTRYKKKCEISMSLHLSTFRRLYQPLLIHLNTAISSEKIRTTTATILYRKLAYFWSPLGQILIDQEFVVISKMHILINPFSERFSYYTISIHKQNGKF